MWAKLVKLVLMPLVEKSVVALWHLVVGYVSEYFRKRKLKKANETKVEEYENSDSVNDSIDDFGKLP